MKKIASLLLSLVLFALLLTSCGSDDTIAKFVENLGSEYYMEIETSTEDLEDLSDDCEINIEAYGVTKAIYVEHNKYDRYAMILECSSASLAKELNSNESKSLVKLLEEIVDVEFETKVVGKYFIVGDERTISDITK